VLRAERLQFQANEEAGKAVKGKRSKVPLAKASQADIDEILGDI
jgi:hypothetical protein